MGVVNDPDLAQHYTILRSSGGAFLNGVWQNGTVTIPGFGVISVAKARDTNMLPGGDKITGAMVFWSSQVLYGTRNGANADLLIWNDLQWRILEVKQYKDYGYWRAIAERLKAV